MSRWFLTSNEDCDRKARSACERARLRPSGTVSALGLFGNAYFKRVHSTENVTHCGNDAWICSAGTIIYLCGNHHLSRRNRRKGASEMLHRFHLRRSAGNSVQRNRALCNCHSSWRSDCDLHRSPRFTKSLLHTYR